MAGYIGTGVATLSNASEKKYKFTASSAQTTFSSINYQPGFVHVFQNGVRLVEGTDYTASTGNSIVFSEECTSGDEIVIISYINFALADMYSKTEIDNRFNYYYPVGSLREHPSHFPGVSPLSDIWKLCDGSLIDDANSPCNGYRIFNFTGDDVVLTLDWTADAGGAYATVAAADRWAINVGDWVAGSGLAAGDIVTAMDRDTGEVIISDVSLAGSVEVTFSNDGIVLTGGSSDKISHADQMQRITGSMQLRGISGVLPGNSAGAFSDGETLANSPADVTADGVVLEFDSSNSPNARTSTETYGRTKPHGQRMPIYMRIK